MVKSNLFATYFPIKCSVQMESMFGKYWSLLLYMRYIERRSGNTLIAGSEIKAMSGYYQYDKMEQSLVRAQLPIIKVDRDIMSRSDRFELTPYGRWLTDFMWKAGDVLLKSAKAKTLTNILEEKTNALKMTIQEINDIAKEEEESPDVHNKILEMNDKINIDAPMPMRSTSS